MGRALFYAYVGILLIGLFPKGNVIFIIIYIALGAAFLFVGFLQMLMYYKCCCWKSLRSDEAQVV